MAKQSTSMELAPKNAKEAMIHCIKMKMPTFLWGPPGIGKSQIIAQIAEEMGYGFIDVRLSQMDPTDLRGIPFPTKENGEHAMKWAPPAILPTENDAQVIILLDEMNTAAPSIQAAAYQLVLDRKLGEYILPENCVVMAAGNRETDRGSTFKMAKPLQNRFVHLNLKVDFNDWQEWALMNNINEAVVGYLTWQKQELFEFDPKSASTAFPTPRSWEFVSRLISEKTDLPNNTMLTLIAGAVGDGVALKFNEYKKKALDLPNPSEILLGNIKKFKNKDTSLWYALATGLCYELKQANEELGKKNKEAWDTMSDNFLYFIMENMQPEMVVLAARTALSIYQLPFNHNNSDTWNIFSEKYADLIIDSGE